MHEKAGDIDTTSSITRFLEPATLFSILTGGLFICGKGYLYSYFDGLNIQLNSLDFSSFQYLTSGIPPIVFSFLIVVLSLMLARKNQPATHLEALAGNMIAIAVVASFLVYANYPEYQKDPRFKPLASMINNIGIILAAFTVLITLLKKSVGQYLLTLSPVKRIFGILMILLFSNMTAVHFGRMHSFMLLKKNNTQIPKIRFSMNSGSSAAAEINGKTFFLILNKNGKYYFTDELKPSPRIFILTERAVDLVEITRTRKITGKDSKSDEKQDAL